MSENKKYISILVPSRERFEKLEKFISSIVLNTNEITSIEVIIRIDYDDKTNYNPLIKKYNFCKFIKGETTTMGKLNRDCVSKSEGKVVFFSNDDVVFRTRNWDVIVKNKIRSLSDDFYLIYPNDLNKGKKLSTFPILNKKTLVENPFLLPEFYKGSFLDLHIMDIFKQYKKGKNLFYLENVICEHQHFRKDITKFDDTYKRRNRFGDDMTFIISAPTRKLFVEHFILNKSFNEIANKKIGNIFDLLQGHAKFNWKIKLFMYMFARQLYKLIYNGNSF